MPSPSPPAGSTAMTVLGLASAQSTGPRRSVSILVPCARVERRMLVVFWSKAIQRAMGKPSRKYELVDQRLLLGCKLPLLCLTLGFDPKDALHLLSPLRLSLTGEQRDVQIPAWPTSVCPGRSSGCHECTDSKGESTATRCAGTGRRERRPIDGRPVFG